MKSNDLDAIETRLNALPELPWRGDDRGDAYAIVGSNGLAFVGEFNDPDERDDAVEVMNSVPALIAEIRRLQVIEATAKRWSQAIDDGLLHLRRDVEMELHCLARKVST